MSKTINLHDSIRSRELVVGKVDWHSTCEPLKAIRKTVFIDEQKVPLEEEWDGLDKNCTHVLAVLPNNQTPVGVARILPSGKIGRVAVLKSYRDKKIGVALVKYCVRCVLDASLVPYLDAQVSALGFYEKLGFLAEGEVLLDANIPHRRMVFNHKV